MKKTSKILSIIIILNIIISILFGFYTTTYAAATVEQKISTDIDGIDEDEYPGIKEAIQKLQKSHPNWTFKVLYTGLKWDDVVKGETSTHGTNVVSKTNYSKDWVCTKCGTTKLYSGGGWYCASDDAVEYMMDVRNSLNESDVFQFLELSYNSNTTYDKSAIKNILTGTFLDDGNLDTYVNTIMTASKKYKINPYYVVTKIIQEQGTKGGSTFKMLGESSNGEFNLNEDDKVITVLAGTTVKDINSYLDGTFTVKDANGKDVSNTSSVVATGYTVDKYTIVVLGDVNGDGKINVTDYIKIKNYILKKITLNDYQQIAADVNEDNNINVTDYILIKNDILSKAEITLKGNRYYYNIFNINATGSTTSEIVANALSKAKKEDWSSVEKCLEGGIEFLANGYITIGQDTMYFEKFNVVNTTKGYSYYTHQYAQDLLYAQNQGTKLKSTLSSIKAIDNQYTFIIPVYEGMPSAVCSRPISK